MKIKSLIGLLIGMTSFISMGYASPPGGVYNNNRPPVYSNSVYSNNSYRDHVSVSVATPNFYANFDDGYRPYIPHHRHTGMGPEWINMQRGFSLPSESVVSGGEHGYPLFVCRGDYRGGEHPGKLLPDNACHISYGGREIIINNYQVLIAHQPLQWIPATYGFIPGRAIVGGTENGRPLYICQASYAGGEHSGKVVGTNCNIPYGGREISIPYYNVLTM